MIKVPFITDWDLSFFRNLRLKSLLQTFQNFSDSALDILILAWLNLLAPLPGISSI